MLEADIEKCFWFGFVHYRQFLIRVEGIFARNLL